MQFSKDELKQKFQLPLPGLSSHLKMAPKPRVQDLINKTADARNAQKSAVLILFFQEYNELKMIVIRRSSYVGVHSGQIAFPGGRFEVEDIDVQTTALREIEEEIGISREDIEIIGRLSDIYVPPSNFLISVFVGYLTQKPVFNIDKREVHEVIELTLNDFFAENVIHEKEFVVPSTAGSVNAAYYNVGNVELWGASAMVMTELLDVLKKEE